MSLLTVHQLLPEINYFIYSQLSEKRSTIFYQVDSGSLGVCLSVCLLTVVSEITTAGHIETCNLARRNADRPWSQTKKQEAQLSPAKRPTLVHADVKIWYLLDTQRYKAQPPMLCCLGYPPANDCNLLAEFSDFYLPSPTWRRTELTGSYLVQEKLEWLVEGRTIIDSVVSAQYINVTDTQTATSP